MLDSWWVSDAWNIPQIGPVYLVSWIVWVIGSITLHELGHGVAALRLGDTTPRDTGHMSWNPVVHMGQMSLILFAFLGIAFGTMPVDTSRLRGRHGDAIVSLAGPAVNLILAVSCLIALPLWVAVAGESVLPGVVADDTLRQNMKVFLFLGAELNVVLLLFNLIPILPLDGGRVLAHYSPKYREFASSENGQWVILGVFILIFFAAGKHLFSAASSFTYGVAESILSVIAPESVPLYLIG